ncbi:MAG TPA: amino acid adenylation domain-containing protein [Micromonosporaceae bacterium]
MTVIQNGTLIHEAVLAAARRHPDRAALVDSTGGALTYRTLLLRVDGLAQAIRARTGPDQRIAVVSRKTPATVLAMLAVLHAGRSYVPIDPAAPAARRQEILDQAGCTLLLASSAADLDQSAVPGLEVSTVAPAVEPTEGSAAGTPHPGEPVGPDHEAYVLYTSGSTGTPKGVVITHRNALAFIGWAAQAFPLRQGDQVAVHAPLHFDLPVYDLYVGLAGGATLHLVDERTALFPQALHRFLSERAITHLYAVPSALVALLHRSTLVRDGLPALRQLLYAGEEFPPAALANWMAAVPGASVTNLYGPIETNVVTSWAVAAPPAPEQRVPLGRPVGGAVLALLAEDGSASEQAAGEGEIVVAGDCVTPGYLHRPDLTERAMVNLRTESGPDRFYRTGDFARRDEDGLLHLLGRRDGMVKTRGFRVELGDIEAALTAHPDVAEVAVVATADPELTHRLHAVVLPVTHRCTDLITADELAERLVGYCRTRLPGYMVPEQIHVVRDLPRTSTGKIARGQLTDLLAGPAGVSR